jgi:hypothetical protein
MNHQKNCIDEIIRKISYIGDIILQRMQDDRIFKLM